MNTNDDNEDDDTWEDEPYDPEADRARILYNLTVGRVETLAVVRWLLLSFFGLCGCAYLATNYVENKRELTEMTAQCAGIGPNGASKIAGGTCTYITGACSLDSAEDGKSTVDYTFTSRAGRTSIDFQIGHSRDFQPSDYNTKCGATVWNNTIPSIFVHGKAVDTDEFYVARTLLPWTLALFACEGYLIFVTVSDWRRLRSQSSLSELKAKANAQVAETIEDFRRRQD